MKWMKENNIHHRWILPQLNLNENTRYSGRPVGNSPELMPLDCSINQYVHQGVIDHIALTRPVRDDDGRKFSLATPKEGVRAYKRVWEGCPSSELINGDIDKVFRSMNLIVENDGRCVPEIGNRREGRRRAAAGEPARQVGG